MNVLKLKSIIYSVLLLVVLAEANAMEKSNQERSILHITHDVIRDGILTNLKGSSLPESVKNIKALAHSNPHFLRMFNHCITTDFTIKHIGQTYKVDNIKAALALRTSGVGLRLKDRYPLMDEKTKNILREAFVQAATNGKVGLVSFLLQYIPQLVNQSVIRSIDDHVFADEPALMMAASKGHAEIVKKLILAGANVNYKNDCGYTPLHRAAREGHTEIVQLLLDAGASQSALNTGYYTGFAAIVEARIGNHFEVIQLLKSRMGLLRKCIYFIFNQ